MTLSAGISTDTDVRMAALLMDLPMRKPSKIPNSKQLKVSSRFGFTFSPSIDGMSLMG